MILAIVKIDVIAFYKTIIPTCKNIINLKL